MKTTMNFGSVKPKPEQAYAEPVPNQKRARLLAAGASTFGSHAVLALTGCLRSFAIRKTTGPLGVPATPPASDRSGNVVVLLDPPESVIQVGPVAFGALGNPGDASVYMIRGTLAHVLLAHAFIRGSLARGESVVVAGSVVEPTLGAAPDDWYTPAEAVEETAAGIGSPAWTYALPAARRMLPALEAWVAEVLNTERVIAVETQLAWHLKDAPYAYTARLDLVTQHRASGLWSAWDYKTSGDPEGDKRRYAASAQLMGQDQMGALWVGSRWGGVRVLLIGEKSGQPVTVTPWSLPRNPRAHDLAHGIVEVQRRAVPYFGRPVGDWPTNPLFCGDCAARNRARCHIMG